MSVAAGASLKQTALNTSHREARAKMVDYCGWDMPVEYSGISREHLAVRTAAGLFDVSHMGEIDVRGPQALALLQHVTSNDVSALHDGQAQYSALMLPNGACIDDCVVHRFSPEHYFICVNAANTDRDYDWIVECNTFGADVENVSSQYSQIALQGPKSVEILKKISGSDPSTLKYYWFRPETVAGIKGILARTGYTGEDGFEFYFPPASSVKLSYFSRNLRGCLDELLHEFLCCGRERTSKPRNDTHGTAKLGLGQRSRDDVRASDERQR